MAEKQHKKNLTSQTLVVHETVDKELDNNEKIREQIKIVKRIIPVRRGVKERKQWAKFGDREGYQRGEHVPGDFHEYNDLKIETKEGVQREEINIVSDILNLANPLKLLELQQNQQKKLEEQEENNYLIDPSRQIVNPVDNKQFISVQNTKPSSSGLSKLGDWAKEQKKEFTLQVRGILKLKQAKDQEEREEEQKNLEDFLKSIIGSHKDYKVRFISGEDRRGDKFLRDFVYINFYNQDEATQALEKIDNKNYDGCILDCKWAKEKEENNKNNRHQNNRQQ